MHNEILFCFSIALASTQTLAFPQMPQYYGSSNPWDLLEQPFDPWAQAQPEQPPVDPLEEVPCARLDFKIDSVPKYQCIMRPSLYVPELKACVPAFTEKFCSPGQWLVPDSRFNNTRGTCEPNICPEAIPATPTSPFFTFAHNGECYTTNTTAYCKPGQRLAFSTSLQDSRYKSPECRDSFFLSEPCIPGAPQSFTAGGKLSCKPGQVMTSYGCSVPTQF